MQSIKGFLVDINWDERDECLYLYIRTDQGILKVTQTNERPLFFIPADVNLANDLQCDEIKQLALKSFDQKNVQGLYFKKQEHLQKAKEVLARDGIRSYENDIRVESRFLMERFIHGALEVQGDIKKDPHKNILTSINPSIKACEYHAQLTSLSLDIETARDGRLLSIGLAYYENNRLSKEICYMLAEEDRVVSNVLELCDSEKKLLVKLNQFFQDYDPDLVLGWHIVGFDLLFLYNKSLEFNYPLYLSRNNDRLSVNENNGNTYCDIRGRQIIDGPPTLRLNFFSFKNYKLDTVANELLGTGKDIESTGESKVEEIERRFIEDKEGLAHYNLLDCKLVFEVYDKIKLIDLLIARSVYSGQTIERVPFSSQSFDHFFLPRLHRKGYVAPNVLDISREDAATGGMVIEPQVGLFENVAVFDFKSLYPSIIRTFFIDPYSLLKNDIEPIQTPSGHQFSKKEYILAGYIEKLMGERAKAKRSHNSALSQAIKILMNSFYGVMGSQRSRFYHADLPNSITKSGHWILNRSIDFFKNHSLEVLYGDTDSLFVHINREASQEELEKIADDLNHYLKVIIQDEFKVESQLEVEFEKMYQKLFFSPMRNSSEGAKKRYVGYLNGKLDFVGMEYVRSDWTELAKNFQYQLFEALFMGENVEKLIKDTIKNLENDIYYDELVYTKRLSKRPWEYTKNIPPHIKAALELSYEEQKSLKEISYIMSLNGPKAIGSSHIKPDTKFYIEKQIKPIAQTVLSVLDMSFDSLVEGDQLTLF
jgi:DNA polymerase-2